MRPYRHAPTPSPNQIGDTGAGSANSGQSPLRDAAARQCRLNDGYRARLTAARWLSAAKINHPKPRQRCAKRSGTDLAHWLAQGKRHTENGS
jgi:hypothetical protein